MLNLYDPLPRHVVADGKKWTLTPAFDNVLKLLHLLDEELPPEEQVELALFYLLAKPPPLAAPVSAELLDKTLAIFFPDREKPSERQKAFDFIQDADLIYAAFYQAYRIDLLEQQGAMHWLRFLALFQGLPESTRFQEVVALRLRPLPKPTKDNAEQRAALMRAKQAVALKLSDAERQRNLQDGLRKMAVALLERAKKESR